MERIWRRREGRAGGIAAFGLLLVAAGDAAPSSEQIACRVEDVDVAAHYSGGCFNGLAHGAGAAKGRDTYEGEFLAGRQHGRGIYSWGVDSKWAGERYDGWWFHGERTGFGELSYDGPAALRAPEELKRQFSLENGRYVVRGLWLAGNLVESCASYEACMRRRAAAFGLSRRDCASLVDGKQRLACYDSGGLGTPDPALSHSELVARLVVQNFLSDPQSAVFGAFTMASPTTACLTVNSKNQFGGYTGDVEFALILRHGLVWEPASDPITSRDVPTYANVSLKQWCVDLVKDLPEMEKAMAEGRLQEYLDKELNRESRQPQRIRP